MNYYKTLKKSLTSLSALVNAIDDGKNQEIIELINLGVNLEQGYKDDSLSPLQIALLKKNFGICTILLDKGASPNKPYYHLPNDKNTLTQEIYRGELSNVKILLIYGAEISNAELEKAIKSRKELFTKELLLKYRDAGQSRYSLLQNMKPQQEDALCNTYKRLQVFWLEQTLDESNEVYRRHYQKKADEFLSLYIELSTFLSPKHNNDDSKPEFNKDKYFDFHHETKECIISEGIQRGRTKPKLK